MLARDLLLPVPPNFDLPVTTRGVCAKKRKDMRAVLLMATPSKAPSLLLRASGNRCRDTLSCCSQCMQRRELARLGSCQRDQSAATYMQNYVC